MKREPPWQAWEIRFTRKQIIWLLPFLGSLRIGDYPIEASNYTDAPITKRHPRAGAYFEAPCEIGAEIDFRLAQVGLDRYLIEDRHIKDILEEDIAHQLGLVVGEIYRRINSALAYMSGWKRKRYSYAEFKAHRRLKLSQSDT